LKHKYALSLLVAFLLVSLLSPSLWTVDHVERALAANISANTIGTSTDLFATRDSFQHKGFYTNGLFWQFYTSAAFTNIVYRTSADGTTWSGANITRANDRGHQFSLYFDGTYLHYAGVNVPTAGHVYYRRGIPNANGTITWSADEQDVYTSTIIATPSISVDSSGYAFITFKRWNGTANTPFIIKSGNNDGTWGTTPSPFPYELDGSVNDNTWLPCVVALTATKMLVVYQRDSQLVNFRSWNGSAWNAIVQTATVTQDGGSQCVCGLVAEGDNAHLVWPTLEGPILYRKQISYVNYTYATNSLSTEAVIHFSTSPPNIEAVPVLSRDATTGTLYCFWSDEPTADHIYYLKRVSGVWDSNETDWINESTDTTTNEYTLDCFYNKYGSWIGIEYMTKAGSPYNIRFAALDLTAADTTPPTYTLPSPSYNTTAGGQPCLLSCQWVDGVAVSMVFESDNASGSWSYNNTVTLSSGWANFTVTLPSAGIVVGYYWIANDTSNNWNVTMPIQTLTTTDTTPPTYTLPSPSYNATVTGQPCLLSCQWTDGVAVSMVFQSNNASGSWSYNNTVTLSSGWANFTVTLPSAGIVVGYYWIANDTSNNWNVTMPIQTLTTTAAAGWGKIFLAVPNAKISQIMAVPVTKINKVDGVP
jgi:hypothetical protein